MIEFTLLCCMSTCHDISVDTFYVKNINITAVYEGLSRSLWTN